MENFDHQGDTIPISPEAADAMARLGKRAESARLTEIAKKIDLGTHYVDRQLENYEQSKWNGKVKPYVPDYPGGNG